ncbi:MAG: YifB family Mg chelatase-like AAA ATPase [Candidatus Omnitrophota bacterium]
MFSKTYSASLTGIDAYLIEIETDIYDGLPQVTVVGLPDTAVKESKDRVKSAIKNSDFKYPVKKITINLAPADVKKEGSIFDLPIALGILACEDHIGKEKLSEYIICGELALDGSVRKIKGALSIACLAAKLKKNLLIPSDNAAEAAVVNDIIVYPISTLAQCTCFLNHKIDIEPAHSEANKIFEDSSNYEIDFSDVKGQYLSKRALEVAVAGGHNVLLIGPPGSGKTMLVKRIPTICPELTLAEALEVTKIHSSMGLLSSNTAIIATRPFRSPHHTTSDVALVGGGSYPRPGEVSLAHRGVLFLDELPEFHRNVLEALRQPLEDREVTIVRAAKSLTLPSDFMLACAMNPCPCGHLNTPKKSCHCTPYQVQKYRNKISGPLLDRIDIQIEVPQVAYKELSQENTDGETSKTIKRRINKVRKIQYKRFKKNKILTNAQMNHKLIKKYCVLDEECKNLLKMAINELGLSARAYDRILKVARTIADLEESDNIRGEHISEAIQYRSLDRSFG